MYRVQIAEGALLFYEQAPASLQRGLDRCFDWLKMVPRKHPNIKRLSGRLVGYYRFRVGDYRVVYHVDDREGRVVVNRIAHRRHVYE